MAFRSAKTIFAPWYTIYPDRHSNNSKLVTAPSKRSRWFSPGATLRSQLQRIPRPARSGNAAMLLTLPIESRHAAPAPLIALTEAHAKYSQTATRAQVHVNSTGARGGRRDEESGDQLAPVHLQRLQITFQWDSCCCSCQARAQRRRTSSCMVKINLLSRRAVCLAAVLPRQFGAAHATMLACVSQCTAVCDKYVVLPCSRV